MFRKGSKILSLLGLMFALSCAVYGQVTLDQIQTAKESRSAPATFEKLLMASYGHNHSDEVKDAFFGAIKESFEELKTTTSTSIATQGKKSALGRLLLLARNAPQLLKPDHITYINTQMLPIIPQFMGSFNLTAATAVQEEKLEEQEEVFAAEEAAAKALVVEEEDEVVVEEEEEATALSDLPEPEVQEVMTPEDATEEVVTEEVVTEEVVTAEAQTPEDANLQILQTILQTKNENEQIKDTYTIMQQAVGLVFDAETKNSFAQTLIHVFNNARKVTTYMTQLLNAASKTTLLNQDQRDYVTTQMIPIMAPAVQPDISVEPEESVITEVPTKKTKKKKKISLKKWLKKYSKKPWVKKKIAKYNKAKWKKLTKKQKRKLIKKWKKARKKKGKKKKVSKKKKKKKGKLKMPKKKGKKKKIGKKKKKKKKKGKLKMPKKKKKKKKKKKSIKRKKLSGPPLA